MTLRLPMQLSPYDHNGERLVGEDSISASYFDTHKVICPRIFDYLDRLRSHLDRITEALYIVNLYCYEFTACNINYLKP